MAVIVRFDRIGRTHPVVPLRLRDERLVEEDVGRVIEKIYAYAGPMLFSRDIDVTVDLDERRGAIFVGMRLAGHFTLTEEEDQE